MLSLKGDNMKIFISHSSKDKELVLMFIDLLVQGFHIDNNELRFY